MFLFTLITVGKLKNKCISTLVDDYRSRLERRGKIETVSVPNGNKEAEGLRILEHLYKRKRANSSNPAKVFVLAEEGQGFTSQELAATIESLQGQHAVFVVGGAYGVSDDVKTKAEVLLSLSPLTFTHELAQLLLYEQLYRTVSILSGSKYHHS